MRISGQLDMRRVRARRLNIALACLFIGGGGFWFFHRVLTIPDARTAAIDPLTQAMVLGFFPVMAAGAFVLMLWSDGWRIVEFTCDEQSFRFRKQRGGDLESHSLGEVARVQDVYRRGGGRSGYSVTFLDGSEAYLSSDLPNSDELAQWLRSHRQPACAAPTRFGGFLRHMFGRVQMLQVTSPAVEARVRRSYAREIAQLEREGFAWQSTCGEAFSLARLLLGLPAVVVVNLLANGRPMAFAGLTRIMACYPLLISRDETTFATPSITGTKLYTMFGDGSFLVSTTAPSDDVTGPPMTRCCRAPNIPSLCAGHRERVEKMEAAGRQAVRKPYFRAFVELSDRETALL